MLEKDAVESELKTRGMKANDLGTHSTRKGAATYCSSGSTACPSITAVHLRAGWALGGVQDTYLRYQEAGDQHVGRTVTGLPPERPEFATLPPAFPSNSPVVDKGIDLCFRNLPENMRLVGRYCLASIVYHSDFLFATLKKKHPLFKSALFREKGLLNDLKNLLSTSKELSDNGVMQPTGVPPHISILSYINELIQDVKTLFVEIQKTVPDTVQGVNQILEDKAIGAGTVTRDGLREMLYDCLRDAGVTSILPRLNELDNRTTDPRFNQENIANGALNIQTFLWGGRMHPVPEGFTLPICDCETIWEYWLCGDAEKNIPPLKHLQPFDFTHRNQKKRFSDLKYLMYHFMECLAADDLTSNISISEARIVYSNIKDKISLHETTKENHRRRKVQTLWTTMVTYLRKAEK